jgi:hypothetical protein
MFLEVEALTKVTVKSYAFWNITPCNFVKVDRSFGGTNRLRLLFCLLPASC